MLEVIINQPQAIETGDIMHLTSIAANVTTAFIVASCKASDWSRSFHLNNDTESLMRSSECGNPFLAWNSSSREAV
jgi:hypothetical protein